MGTFKRIEIKLETERFSPEKSGVPVVGTEIKVFGRVYDTQTREAESEWFPIYAKSVQMSCEANDYAEATIRLRPSEIHGMTALLAAVELDHPLPDTDRGARMEPRK